MLPFVQMACRQSRLLNGVIDISTSRPRLTLAVFKTGSHAAYLPIAELNIGCSKTRVSLLLSGPIFGFCC